MTGNVATRSAGQGCSRGAALAGSLIAILALCLGGLASTAAAKKRPPQKYRVVLTMEKGRYRSNIDLGHGTTFNETDNFDGVKQVYNDIAIPRSGHVGADDTAGLSPSSQQLAFPEAWGGSSWEAFGQGTGGGTTGSYHCNGRLAPKGTPKLEMKQAGHNLRLVVPLVKDIAPAGVSGGGYDNFSCNYYGQNAFVPAINDTDPNKFLDAVVTVNLHKVRSLKKRRGTSGHKGYRPPGHKDVKVDESDAEVRVKDQCGNESYTCTQHLNWHGTVRILRQSD